MHEEAACQANDASMELAQRWAALDTHDVELIRHEVVLVECKQEVVVAKVSFQKRDDALLLRATEVNTHEAQLNQLTEMLQSCQEKLEAAEAFLQDCEARIDQHLSDTKKSFEEDSH